jgi:hypothetical protein
VRAAIVGCSLRRHSRNTGSLVMSVTGRSLFSISSRKSARVALMHGNSCNSHEGTPEWLAIKTSSYQVTRSAHSEEQPHHPRETSHVNCRAHADPVQCQSQSNDWCWSHPTRRFVRLVTDRPASLSRESFPIRDSLAPLSVRLSEKLLIRPAHMFSSEAARAIISDRRT